MIKYLQFSWTENGKRKSSHIGIAVDGCYLKIRWLDRSALPLTRETLDILEKTVRNMNVAKSLNRNEEEFRVFKRYGTSGCSEYIAVVFPYCDEFKDYGIVRASVHVSMYSRFNEPIIFEGKVVQFYAIVNLMKSRINIATVDNIEVMEFQPFCKKRGESNFLLDDQLSEEEREFCENFEYEKIDCPHT